MNAAAPTRLLAVACLLAATLAASACSRSGPASGEPDGAAASSDSTEITSTTPIPAATSPLRVSGAWATRNADGKARVYVDIMNPGFSPVHVVRAQVNLAGQAQLCDTDDSAACQELPDGLRIDAGRAAELSPGGHHILVSELSEQWVPGQRVVTTLTTSTGEITRFSAFVQSSS